MAHLSLVQIPMEVNELVDLNNNELDMIGLHSSRAEMDFSAELNRLNMENRPLTPGAPLRRSEKITNFPSRINFDEMGLADDSSVDINGNFDLLGVPATLVPTTLPPIPVNNLPSKLFYPSDLESSTLTGTLLHAPSSSRSKIVIQPSLPPTAFLVPPRRPKQKKPPTISSVPSAFQSIPEPKWGLDTIPSESDKSGGDRGGSIVRNNRRSTELPLFDSSTIGDASSKEVANALSIPSKFQTETGFSTIGPSVSVYRAEKAAPPHSSKPSHNPSTNVKASESVLTSASASQATSSKKTPKIAAKQPIVKSGESSKASKNRDDDDDTSKTSSTKSSKSSKSSGSSGSSKSSGKAASKAEADDDEVKMIREPEGKRGAIMFKVPGRLTHKTTIKVSHFPQNNSQTPTVGVGNAECVVEDVIPQQQPQQQQNCPPSPQPGQNAQNAAAMQQMMAYQQYYGGMQCNPYSYYPYGGGGGGCC